jgi:hypothetical protein
MSEEQTRLLRSCRLIFASLRNSSSGSVAASAGDAARASMLACYALENHSQWFVLAFRFLCTRLGERAMLSI